MNNPYEQEAKDRWGNTEAYRQSQERVAKMTKADMDLIGKKNDELMREIVASMNMGPQSPEIQALMSRHYDGLRNFYEPNPEMYKGLAEMYVADSRFTAYYENYAAGLAQFMRDAMVCYAESLGVKTSQNP